MWNYDHKRQSYQTYELEKARENLGIDSFSNDGAKYVAMNWSPACFLSLLVDRTVRR